MTETDSGGSNAWAVEGTHTSSRAPLLASDPHLPLSAPSTWHPVQISAPGLDVIGGSIAGVPAVVIGRNADIGWGITSAQIDDLDLFIERIDPENPARYETPDGPAPFVTTEETILVRGKDPVRILRRETRHGPVLPTDLIRLANVTPRGHVPALSWTGLADDDTSFAALLMLNRAESVPEALRSVDGYVAPAVNLLVADSRMVGIGLAGRVPLRRLTSKIQGRLPSPGWTDDHRWIGALPLSTLPRAINPASGIIANANNRISDNSFPRHLGFDWAPPYRLSRIAKLLGARDTHSVESFRAMQVDSVSEMARTIAPLIGAGIWDSGKDEDAHPLRAAALDRLRSWNGAMSEHDPEPLIFSAWLSRLVRDIAGDELGGLIREYDGLRPLFVERVYRDLDGAARWCDDTRTTDIEETCTGMAASALDAALEGLSMRYGDDLTLWRWGAAHVAMHRHAGLGDLRFDLGPITLSPAALVNIEMETSGGDYTLNKGASPHHGSAPFANTHGAGMRAVYDLADLDRSRFIVSTGASGHFLSQHYANLAPLWRTGELVPMSTDREDIAPGALGTLALFPAQPTGESVR